VSFIAATTEQRPVLSTTIRRVFSATPSRDAPTLRARLADGDLEVERIDLC
jgi:hypothetical protein